MRGEKPRGPARRRTARRSTTARKKTSADERAAARPERKRGASAPRSPGRALMRRRRGRAMRVGATRQGLMRRRDDEPAAREVARKQRAEQRLAVAGRATSVGSSSSHSGRGARRSRASPARRRCPAERTPPGRSSAWPSATASAASHESSSRASPPPRRSAPEAQRLPKRQARLQRIQMAEEVRGAAHAAARPCARSRPPAAGARRGCAAGSTFPAPFGSGHGEKLARREPKSTRRRRPAARRARRRDRATSSERPASGASAASRSAAASNSLRTRSKVWRRRTESHYIGGSRRDRRSSSPDPARQAATVRFVARRIRAPARMDQGALPVTTPSLDSFKCRRTLDVAGKTYTYFSLPEAEKNGLAGISRLPFSLKVLLENLLRFEDGRSRHRRRHPRRRRLAEEAQLRPRDRLPPGARADAGFHRRSGGRRPRGDARRDDAARRRPAPDQSAGAGRSRHRPFGDGRLLRHRRTPSSKNVELEYERNGERYTFLRWGQEAFENFRVVPPGTGICHQVNLEYLAQTVWTRDEREDGQDRHLCLSRHARRHRLAHDDGQRPLGARLGRRRHRGGGRHARPADLHAHSRSHRLPHDRQAAGRHDRDRSRAHRHADAAQEGRGRQVRRVLRPRPVEPVARGPGDDRQHGAGIWRDLRLLPDRATTRSPISRATGREPDRVALVEAYAKAQGMWRADGAPDPVFTDTLSSSISATVVPSLAGPKRPQDRVRARPTRRRRSRRRCSEIRGGAGRRAQGRQAASRSTDTNYSIGDGACRDRRDHVLHQHLQPERADRRRPPRQEGAREGPDAEAVGEDLAGAGLAGRHRVSRRRPGCSSISTRSASTSSAMAAPPASAIPARCRSRSPRRSTRTTSSPARCSPATATSRAGSIRTCGRTISPRRRSSSPTRSPAR